MSFIHQFQNISGNALINRRQALIGISLLALTACSRSGQSKASSAASDVAYYTCTMHAFVRSQDPKGKCPVCGMSLVPVLKSSTKESAVKMVFIAPERLNDIGAKSEAVTIKPGTSFFNIPVDAVFPAGNKSIVFIDHG